MRRRAVLPSLLLLLLLVTVLVARPAAAQTQTPTETGLLDQAAAALPRDPVYEDPSAELADQVDPGRLRDRIRSAGTPVFVAVLPGAAAQEAGGVNEAARALSEKVGLAGTYAVVTGRSFRAYSTSVRGAGTLATAAAQASDGNLQAALEDFIGRVGAAARGGSGGSAGSAPFDDGQEGSGSGDGEGGGGSMLPLVLLLGGGGAGLWYFARKRREREAERAKQDEHDRGILQAELSVLADDVMRLEPQIALQPAAADDYEAATSRFRVAQAALEHADDPIDLVRVQRVVDEGRYAMSRAKAIVDGREPPPPPAELTRPGRRGEPAVDVDEDGQPAYVGAGGFGGPFYGGGWFGGGGGLLTGLFLGQMLGGGWGWGHGGGDVTNISHEGGGDWGGGDFGAGDFGGGDFGGGDFGGGDF